MHGDRFWSLNADSNLRKFHVGPGHKNLIYCAFGAIGSAALQLAKAYGAEVTAVVATRRLELVKSLGADRAIDYTAEDFTRIGERFDFVFKAVGKATFDAASNRQAFVTGCIADEEPDPSVIEAVPPGRSLLCARREPRSNWVSIPASNHRP
jgi:NADPH:quinone reductase-like Zn-dependent oxidoreductase